MYIFSIIKPIFHAINNISFKNDIDKLTLLINETLIYRARLVQSCPIVDFHVSQY